MHWHQLSLEAVQEIIYKNKKKEKVASLEEYTDQQTLSGDEKVPVVFENVVGQDNLNRFDRPKRPNNKRKNKRKNNRRRNNA